MDIDEKKNEVLAVPETNTVIYPRTVVIHVDDTPIADGAVMTSLRLKQIAHQTVAFSFFLTIVYMEAPERRNLAWVCHYHLNETPSQ